MIALLLAAAVPSGFYTGKLERTAVEIHVWPPGWTVVRCRSGPVPQPPTVEGTLESPLRVCGSFLLVREGERIYFTGKEKRIILRPTCGFRVKEKKYGTFTSLRGTPGEGGVAGLEVSVVPSTGGDLAVVTSTEGSASAASVVPIRDGGFQVRVEDRVLHTGRLLPEGVEVDGVTLERGAYFQHPRCKRAAAKHRPARRNR